MIFRGGVTYAERDGRALRLDVLAPDGASGAPVVIYVHGGGWSGGDRGAGMHPWSNPFLAEHGYVTVSLTYRLSGEAVWPAQHHDVRDAVAWVRAHALDLGGDPRRIALWGHSAGAHVVAVTALSTPEPAGVQAVAVSACPTDFGVEAGWIDDRRQDQATQLVGARGARGRARLVQASPITMVHAAAPPFLLVHGELDGVVPVDQSRRLHAALRGAGASSELVVVPGADHDWADLPSSRGRSESDGTFGSLAREFFDRWLR